MLVMLKKPEEDMHFKLKITSFPPEESESIMRLALIQNCIVGIRSKTVFGLMPATPQTEHQETMPSSLMDTLTMDVYTSSFTGLSDTAQQERMQIFVQHLEHQWNTLYKNLNTGLKLKMAPFPEQALPSGKQTIPFDQYRWSQLLRELAQLLPSTNQAQLCDNGLLEHNGLTIQLLYTEKNPCMFELRIDLGTIPKPLNHSHVFRAMLMHNHFSGAESGIWWGLHPNQGQVIMATELTLSQHEAMFEAPRAQDILALLDSISSKASVFWQAIEHSIEQAHLIQP
jgi:hypothetical protein